MQKKWIFLAGLLVCLLAGGWAYYNYNKPRAGVTSVAAAHTLGAEQLYDEFATNEATATEKYVGKAIAVTGVVSSVQQSADGATTVLLKAGDAMGGISCSMAAKENRPAEGSTVTIKGRCTGFLMDVNLVDAIIIK